MATVMAIDLGTTFCRYSVFSNGRAKKITHSYDNSRISSHILLPSTENPISMFFNAIRLIGRKSNDPKIKKDSESLPFRLEESDGELTMRLLVPGEISVDWEPIEVISHLLVKMRNQAKERLGYEVNRAVVTVPTCFTEPQRRAIVEAGRRINLDVLRITSSSSAAALEYTIRTGVRNRSFHIIYDIGGGTVDVSLVRIYRNMIVEVISTAGDTYLGGQDFDSRLVKHFCNSLDKDHNIPLYDDPHALALLRKAAEGAKCALSQRPEIKLNIRDLYEKGDFSVRLSRYFFEYICRDLFQEAIEPVKKVLKDADMDKSMIDNILAIGGSSRIPKIRELLQEFFGRPIDFAELRDQYVIYGAEFQAGILSRGTGISSGGNFLLLDVAPQSFGIKGPEGDVIKVIKRNSPIPLKARRIFTTNVENQQKLVIPVYEGEEQSAENNAFVGTFTVAGIEPARRGTPRIVMDFDLDANGILHVSASDANGGSAYPVTKSNRDSDPDRAKIGIMLLDEPGSCDMEN